MDRLIRIYVVDGKGRTIPNATVSVFVNGAFFATATSGRNKSGTVYTVQVSNPVAAVTLKAEYDREEPKEATLAQDADEWTFSFPNVEVPMLDEQPFLEKHFPGLIGVSFLIVTIALAIFIPNPTPFQNRVFAATLAICLGGIAGEISGFVKVDLKIGTKLAITAGGALAVFVIVYFFQAA